jgi:hypothetical protein
LCRNQGDRTDEEKEVLNRKIQQLNDALEAQLKTANVLQAQLKKSQDENRFVHSSSNESFVSYTLNSGR